MGRPYHLLCFVCISCAIRSSAPRAAMTLEGEVQEREKTPDGVVERLPNVFFSCLPLSIDRLHEH